MTASIGGKIGTWSPGGVSTQTKTASWAESQSRTSSNRFGEAQLRRRNSTATGMGARPSMIGASSSSSFSRGSKRRGELEQIAAELAYVGERLHRFGGAADHLVLQRVVRSTRPRSFVSTSSLRSLGSSLS